MSSRDLQTLLYLQNSEFAGVYTAHGLLKKSLSPHLARKEIILHRRLSSESKTFKGAWFYTISALERSACCFINNALRVFAHDTGKNLLARFKRSRFSTPAIFGRAIVTHGMHLRSMVAKHPRICAGIDTTNILSSNSRSNGNKIILRSSWIRTREPPLPALASI